MPHFDIIRKSSPKKTFRVASVMGAFDLEKEQIEERNNKIYIKPTRKIDNYYQYVMKKHKKDVNDDDQFKEPLFVDFMYDIMDEDKKDN